MSDQTPPSQEDLDHELRAELAAERPSGPWQIETRHDLEWALARIGSIQRQVDENAAEADAEIQRITRRLGEVNGRLEKGQRFFESHVTVYATTHRTELLGNGRGKTRQLLNGSIGWRTQPARVEIVDEKAARDWAGEHGEADALFLPQKPREFSLKALAKFIAVADDVPGVRVVPESETLVIKTGGGET